MSAPEPETALTAKQEWRRGWFIVLAAMCASGFGMPLFYYCFSLFTLPMSKDMGVTRGELASAQGLLVVAALTAPLVGGWFDRFGFRRVFAVSVAIMIIAHLATAMLVSELWQFALVALVYGLAGLGSGPLGYTRLVNAWFVQSRGLALGICALGVALTATVVPPLLASLIETQGWRAGLLVLAGLGAILCLPLTLVLARNHPVEDRIDSVSQSAPVVRDRTHLKDRDFWLLVASILCLSIPGAGVMAQVSPMVQEEGIGAQTAALGIVAFAQGQVAGRIIAGWFLDHVNPRWVAMAFTALPAIGFMLLAGFELTPALAIFCVGLIGIQQGAEIDLFAWFTARRFGMTHYGAIYGGVIAGGWLGNAMGVISFGWLHDATGTYVLVEMISTVLLLLGAMLICSVRLPSAEKRG
jgi:nitrate/nitrite transporter NarK